jgi:uncharacterized DUF497 family protein
LWVHSENEDRYLLIGYSQKSHLLFVVHVYKEDKTIRIIIARKATKNEKKDFEEL